MWPFLYPGEQIPPPKPPPPPPYPPVPVADIRQAFYVLMWVMQEPWVRQDDYEIFRQAQHRLGALIVARESTPSGGDDAATGRHGAS